MADLKLPEVARRLGVSERTARRYVRAGELPSVYVGNSYRVSEEDLEKYLEDARVRPGDDSGKVQAPLPLEDEAGPRRTEEYVRCAERLSGFCDHWESRLDREEIDQRSLEEFHVTVEGFVPTLKIAIDAERRESASAELDQVVMDRFIVLGIRMSRARDETLAEESADASTITQLRDYVRKAG